MKILSILCFPSLQGLKVKCPHHVLTPFFCTGVLSIAIVYFFVLLFLFRSFINFFLFQCSDFIFTQFFYSFSVSAMWIVQMTGKIKYCWYCIISKNCPIRTLKKKNVLIQRWSLRKYYAYTKFYVNDFLSTPFNTSSNVQRLAELMI